MVARIAEVAAARQSPERRTFNFVPAAQRYLLYQATEAPLATLWAGYLCVAEQFCSRHEMCLAEALLAFLAAAVFRH